MKNLYKGKYCIGLYDGEDETCIGIFDSVKELSVFLNKKIDIVRNMISRKEHENRQSIVVNRKLVKVELIDMSE